MGDFVGAWIEVEFKSIASLDKNLLVNGLAAVIRAAILRWRGLGMLDRFVGFRNKGFLEKALVSWRS